MDIKKIEYPATNLMYKCDVAGCPVPAEYSADIDAEITIVLCEVHAYDDNLVIE